MSLIRQEHNTDSAGLRSEGYVIVNRGGLVQRDGLWYFSPEAQTELIEDAVRVTRHSLTRELLLPTHPNTAGS